VRPDFVTSSNPWGAREPVVRTTVDLTSYSRLARCSNWQFADSHAPFIRDTFETNRLRQACRSNFPSRGRMPRISAIAARLRSASWPLPLASSGMMGSGLYARPLLQPAFARSAPFFCVGISISSGWMVNRTAVAGGPRPSEVDPAVFPRRRNVVHWKRVRRRSS
jgi:hypothetical protein